MYLIHPILVRSHLYQTVVLCTDTLCIPDITFTADQGNLQDVFIHLQFKLFHFKSEAVIITGCQCANQYSMYLKDLFDIDHIHYETEYNSGEEFQQTLQKQLGPPCLHIRFVERF